MSDLNMLEIYLTKSLKLIPPTSRGQKISSVVATINCNISRLGFVLSPDLFEALSFSDIKSLSYLYKYLVPVLEKMAGSHRKFAPMYPNFPAQVMEASDLELHMIAFKHYWMAATRDTVQGQPRLFGGRLMEGATTESMAPVEEIKVPLQWLPNYEKEERADLSKEEVTLKVINLGSDLDFSSIFYHLIRSNGSLSESDKDILQWFVTNQRESLKSQLPSIIPNKENLAYLTGLILKHEVQICPTFFLKTSTDLLRVAVAMSGGDVSLAKPCKFRRFKRVERRWFLSALESMPSVTEDMLRRPEVWKRLGRELRPGDYAKRYPRVLKSFSVIRNNETYSTFNSEVEKSLTQKDVKKYVDLLSKRPGDFARRLDHAVRVAENKWLDVVLSFEKVADSVSTPVLLQAYAHFKARDKTQNHRSFFPKGSVAKVQVVERSLPPLPDYASNCITDVLRSAMLKKFSVLPRLGRVYIDPAMKTQYVPFAQRSASKSLRTLSRGSRIDLPKAKAVRFFVWWKEPKGIRTDIDLAAVFLDESWKRLRDVSYRNLRQQNWGCAHSGDITSAPNGACEFIDIDLECLKSKRPRYVMMVIYSYTQQPFKDLPECFAGWMARSQVQSGEIFEGRTVQDKIDIAGDTTVNIPLIVDLEQHQLIWADIALKNRSAINNSYSQKNNISLMGRAVTELHKPTLYDLFDIHAEARGIFEEDPSKADIRFGFNGDVTPFDTGIIMSKFMADG